VSDDHNALLARAALIVADGKPGWPTVRDLAAELRALTSRHHTALNIIRRSGLRVSFCGYCGQLCLAGDKRSLCCGDAVYDNEPGVAEFRAVLDQAKDPDHE
jgi:hypothetical protein